LLSFSKDTLPDSTIQCLGNLVIDLGPGGGESGGHIVAQGTPEDIANTPKSLTG
jgi:excinuclease UvrABC ATPase subunit